MARKSSLFTVTALIAAGVGYVAGILTAPASGKKTRKQMAKNASKARIDAEKQLKKLHSDLSLMIKEGEVVSNEAKLKANKKMREALKEAKTAKEKAREVLSALHHGDADDPNLKIAVEEIKAAKSNLLKYLKK